MSSINQRIGDLIAYKETNVTAFSKLIGVAQTSLRDIVNGSAEPKFSTLEKIIIAEPMINAEWLLTGKGEMLLHREKAENEQKDEETNYKEKYYKLMDENAEIYKKYIATLEELRILDKEKNVLAGVVSVAPDVQNPTGTSE